MIVKSIVVGPFMSNCFIVGCEETKKGIVIDPGDEPDRIVELTKDLGLEITYIVLTHGHIDHVRGCGGVHKATGADILIHKDEVTLYKSLSQQASLFGLDIDATVPEPNKLIDEGDLIEFGKIKAKVLFTPGHSPGGITLVIEGGSDKPTALFAGDSLFMNGIGRTDLWGGSMKVLMDSIKEKLMSFPDDTIVYPGHGPETTIGYERRTNPFLQGELAGNL